MTARQVVDAYFLEHRAKLLDLAAFLDRIDRAGDPRQGVTDYRVAAMRRALKLLASKQAGRVGRVLELLSDHSTAPIAKAGGKGASGACPPKAVKSRRVVAKAEGGRR